MGFANRSVVGNFYKQESIHFKAIFALFEAH